MKRRSFLQLLGFAPAAPLMAKFPSAEAAEVFEKVPEMAASAQPIEEGIYCTMSTVEEFVYFPGRWQMIKPRRK